MNDWLLFLGGAVLGAIIELVIRHPWEDLVERRFMQLMKTGIYSDIYFKQYNFDELRERVVRSINDYEFEYARLLIDKLEWFIQEKTKEEKNKARQDANKDYEKDLKNIDSHKPTKAPTYYEETTNEWTIIKIEPRIEKKEEA